MTSRAPFAVLAAALALAACDSAPTTNQAENEAAAANAAAEAVAADMPPPIKSSKPYRCGGDNSVIYVDLFSGDTQAALKETKDGTPVKLVAPEAGKPFVAEGGYSLEVTGGSIKVTTPAGTKTCKG